MQNSGQISAQGRTSSLRSEGGKVCNRRVSPVAFRPGQGPLTQRIAGVQPAGREQVFMPPKETLAAVDAPTPGEGRVWLGGRLSRLRLDRASMR